MDVAALYIMSVFYIFAGLSHFMKPSFFLKIMPKWVPFPKEVNILVGVAEILLGIGILIESLQLYAAWGIITLLVAVFPANVYHYQRAKKKGKQMVPTLIRLPLQGLLIYWAYRFI